MRVYLEIHDSDVPRNWPTPGTELAASPTVDGRESSSFRDTLADFTLEEIFLN